MISTGDLLSHINGHLVLAASALLVALCLGVPLGTASAHNPALRTWLLSLVNMGRVIPSLAMLTLMLPVLGVGFNSAVVALTLLAIPPIAINTDLAFRTVPHAAVDAATGMGMTFWQRIWRVESPLAAPVIFTGVRTAGTELIASATLAAFVGGGGLGEYIQRGLQSNNSQLLLIGSVSVAALAIVVELAFAFGSRLLRRTV
ncbi:MAG: ABC transporter permease [Candidatus Eremiobacteraeota bacterium]|nr:ABC transporter permease [Candidatus Eremiobacteraeota bacterium]